MRRNPFRYVLGRLNDGCGCTIWVMPTPKKKRISAPADLPPHAVDATNAAIRALIPNPDDLTKCRVCGCSQNEPCNPPCGWARAKGNLCTSCDDLAGNIREWMQDVAVLPNLAELVLEVLQLKRMGPVGSGQGFVDRPKPKAKRAGGR